ncbi:MAG TPA: alpha/beta hydrolase [Allosphingosinicella sp.]|nr:alpha/beta hydrolase [Allosphingosinicella sp.]
MREGTALFSRAWRAIGSLSPRGPLDGPKLMVIPGFLASDRTTLGLQRALAQAGYRVTGWGLGLNRGVSEDIVDRIGERVARFGAGEKVILIGWSLGGLYARVVAQERPELVEKVITLGSPFSGDRRRNNNVWRLYEWVARHPVNAPPIDKDPAVKPPVPTLAIWSRKDGIVSPAGARGLPEERDAELELTCSHMGFAVGARAYPKIVEAIHNFAPHGGGNGAPIPGC